MIKKLSLLLTLFCVVFSVSAKRISETAAYNNAVRFSGNAVIYRSGNSATLAYKSDNYYVYNYANGGFVIVSGSDLTDEILGYSKTGTFNKKNIPDNISLFLESYSEQIEYAEKNKINCKSVKSRSSETKHNIEPLIKSTWNQYYPYNAYCPEKNGQKCVTGCVATAMAQIVAYHKSNTNPTGFHKYNSLEIDLDTCAINYENLCINYSGSETIEQLHEIAKLMKVCGYTINMGYGVNASGTNTYYIKQSLVEHFDYNENDAKWICRFEYENQENWENDIYNSLKNSNPIPYQAYTVNKGTGHAFICDGYENGYFHINWGWGGSSDGYFKLNALHASGFDFSFEGYENVQSGGHCAIINLHPNVINTNKNSDNLNPNVSLTLNESTLNIEYVNNSLYAGQIKYSYQVVNEQNDTITSTLKQDLLESGSSLIVSTTISELNLKEGLSTLIPVIYLNDGIKRSYETDIYAAVTPYKSMFTKNKEDVQPFFDKVYAENFKVKKLDNLKIVIEAVNKAYPVRVFDFGGNMIYSGNEPEITLPKSGFYVVKNGSANTSFIIK